MNSSDVIISNPDTALSDQSMLILEPAQWLGEWTSKSMRVYLERQEIQNI